MPFLMATLNGFEGKYFKELIDVVVRLKANITAVQEVGGRIKKHKRSIGFVMGRLLPSLGNHHGE